MVSIRAIDLYLSWWEPGVPTQEWPDWSGMVLLEYLDLSFGSDVPITGACNGHVAAKVRARVCVRFCWYQLGSAG